MPEGAQEIPFVGFVARAVPQGRTLQRSSLQRGRGECSCSCRTASEGCFGWWSKSIDCACSVPERSGRGWNGLVKVPATLSSQCAIFPLWAESIVAAVDRWA